MKWLVALALACGCASTPKLVFGVRPPAGCENTKTPRCLEWYVDRLLTEIGRVDVHDPALVRYVRGVADRLARAGGIAAPPQVRVIDELDPQAEAWAGGTIYVYRGALVRLRSEAELAAVLGHELGHLEGHHSDVPIGTHRADLDDEIEADAIAVHLLAVAGYEPRAVETMLRAVSAELPLTCVDDPTDQHPCVAERIARVRALDADLPAGTLGIERYRAATASLVIGDDPRRATAIGDALVFAYAGLALSPGKATLTAADGRGLLVQGEMTASVASVSRAFGTVLRDHPPEGQAFVIGDHAALWIMVLGGADRSARAAALARFVRPARADELAKIRPTPFDLAAPRRLWPER
jgi:hypothetical protein